MKFTNTLFACAVLGGALGCERPPSAEGPPEPSAPAIIFPGQCNGEAAEYAFVPSTVAVSGDVQGPLALMGGISQIQFLDEKTQHVHYVGLVDGAFETTLPPSRYSVWLQGDYSTYSNYGANRRLLAEGLEISIATDGLSFDADLVEHAIALTFGGEPFPAVARGKLRIEIEETGEVLRRDLPATGDARVVLAAPANATYKLTWSRIARGDLRDFDGVDSPVPFGEVELGQIDGSVGGEHAFDVPADTVQIDGAILLGDVPFPANDLDAPRGQLSIGNIATFDVDRDSEVRFSIPVVPGAYASTFLLYSYEADGEVVNYAQLDLCSNRTARCDDGLCLFDSDRDWRPSVNPFEAAPVSEFGGRVFQETTIRCAQSFPAQGGWLLFTNLDTNGRQSITIDDDGVVQAAALAHGSYRVEYFSGGYSSVAPVGNVTVDASFDFDGTQSPEWTIVASTAYVDITVNGEAMPDDGLLDGEGRGMLVARRVEPNGEGALGWIQVGDFGEFDAATAAFDIIDGTYEFALSTIVPFGKGSHAFLNQNVLPHGIHPIGVHTFEGADMDALAFDVRVSTAQVDIDVAELGIEDEIFGTMTFESDDGSYLAAPYDSTMNVRLYDGTYRSVFRPEMGAPDPNNMTLYGDAFYVGDVCVTP